MVRKIGIANDQIEKGFKIFYDFEQEVKHHYTPNGTWKERMIISKTIGIVETDLWEVRYGFSQMSVLIQR